MAEKPHEKRTKKQSDNNNAKWDLLQEIFNDVYDKRQNIYKVNFFRGVFFGLGTVLGGTVLVAIAIWLLTMFAGYLPGVIGDFIQSILDSMKA